MDLGSAVDEPREKWTSTASTLRRNVITQPTRRRRRGGWRGGDFLRVLGSQFLSNNNYGKNNPRILKTDLKE